MSEFGENWCEELCRSLEANSTVLDHWLVDVKCQEESYNLQSQSLSQQNLFDYPQIQHNANVTNVESTLIPLSNNLPNLFDYPQIQHNANVTNGESALIPLSNNLPNLFDYPQIQHNANVSNVESALIPLSNNLPNLFDYPQIQHNANVTNFESALIPPSNNPPNLFDYPQIQYNANVTNVESALTPLSNNPPNMQSQNDDPPVQHRQRKPRKTWTVKEHVYGMSWKKISKEVVGTKTPSQLASHAQKYFERQKIPPSQRKRKSIHDITLPHVPFNVGEVNVTPDDVHAPPIQDFFMQNIHPLLYAPAQNSYMQNIPIANVHPLQDIQGQQQMPPFNSPYY
ncbi:hypothetical protein V8G54_000725 [Vigna mungo]|uniref:HTH myb-type domain-containing protein n=1 Tax=Vigna mungo TaxID=3915 RepID=A0AAQ3P540_VIGMU